jgi:hypothetical protein
MLGENLRLGEPDASLFSLASHKEERAGERRPFGNLLFGFLPARAWRGGRKLGLDGQFVVRQWPGREVARALGVWVIAVERLLHSFALLRLTPWTVF